MRAVLPPPMPRFTRIGPLSVRLTPWTPDALLAIATANGTVDLSNASYKLFYSRRPSPHPPASGTNNNPSPSPSNPKVPGDDTILIASVVAMREGKIIAKVEPAAGGAELRDAFLALRRHVEVRLDRILQVRGFLAFFGLPVLRDLEGGFC